MLKKDSVFDFCEQALTIFGITIVCLCLFSQLFGETARGHSAMFAFGRDALGIETILQYFMLSALITLFKWVMFTDKIIKRWSIIPRIAVMFALIIITMALFAYIFNWFPIDMPEPWILFLLSFIICAFISIAVSSAREKSDNRRMQEALDKMKEGEL